MVRPRLLILVVTSAIALAACGDGDTMPTESPKQDVVAFDVVFRGVGNPGRYDAAQPHRRELVVVLRSAEEAAAYAKQLRAASVSLAEPLPEVDYTKRMLIVVGASRPTGGYSFDVEALRRTAQGLLLRVVETTPGNCIVTQALTFPHVVIETAQDPAEVQEEVQTRNRDC